MSKIEDGGPAFPDFVLDGYVDLILKDAGSGLRFYEDRNRLRLRETMRSIAAAICAARKTEASS